MKYIKTFEIFEARTPRHSSSQTRTLFSIYGARLNKLSDDFRDYYGDNFHMAPNGHIEKDSKFRRFIKRYSSKFDNWNRTKENYVINSFE